MVLPSKNAAAACQMLKLKNTNITKTSLKKLNKSIQIPSSAAAQIKSSVL